MLPIFSKALEDLDPADLDLLVAERYPEGTTIEYKETLPGKGGVPDPWHSGANEILPYARNKLLAEIVAFANSHGGQLLIGIEETSSKPASANAVKPLPRAADLAERIRMQARDCIEPKLPLLHSTAVVTDASGNGVVIVRVPASRAAPHRLTADLNCYARRSDRTEKMTMREIQDLTLHVERGLANIDAKFGERARLYADKSPTIETSVQRIGIRATAVPLSDINLRNVYRRNPGFAPLLSEEILLDGAKHTLRLHRSPDSERPQLRGTKKIFQEDGDYHALEVFQNGVIDQHYVLKQDPKGPWSGLIPIEWVLALVLSVLRNIDRFREYAGAPDVEYGLEVEMYGHPARAKLIGFERPYDRVTYGTCPSTRLMLPRYSVGSPAEFPLTLGLILQDCTEAVGYHVGFSELKIGS